MSLGLRVFRAEDDKGIAWESGQGELREVVPTTLHDSFYPPPSATRGREFFFRDICLDLFEWSELHKGEPIQFLVKLVRLFESDPVSYQFFIQLVGGNFREWDMTYNERADLNGCTKQNVQQYDFKRFQKISELFPELADVLKDKGGARQKALNAKD